MSGRDERVKDSEGRLIFSSRAARVRLVSAQKVRPFQFWAAFTAGDAYVVFSRQTKIISLSYILVRARVSNVWLAAFDFHYSAPSAATAMLYLSAGTGPVLACFTPFFYSFSK